MSEQLISADPLWGSPKPPPTQPHPEARIGADPRGAHGGDTSDAAPVTLSDLAENPAEAIGRIGTILQKDLSDPKTWMGAAAMFFGPKVFAKAAPMVAKMQAQAMSAPPAQATPEAPGLLRSMVQAAQPQDVGIVSPRVGQALGYIQRVRALRNQPAAEPAPAAAPPETVSGGTPPPAGPPPEPVPEARPKSPQQALNEEAIARRRAEYQARQAEAVPSAPPAPKPTMNAAEVKEYTRLRLLGKTDQQAREAILASRAMNEQMGLNVPTPAETRFPKGMRGKVREKPPVKRPTS